jgi:hypothetical protein
VPLIFEKFVETEHKAVSNWGLRLSLAPAATSKRPPGSAVDSQGVKTGLSELGSQELSIIGTNNSAL